MSRHFIVACMIGCVCACWVTNVVARDGDESTQRLHVESNVSYFQDGRGPVVAAVNADATISFKVARRNGAIELRLHDFDYNAKVIKGEPIAGGIAEPVTDAMFRAVREGRAVTLTLEREGIAIAVDGQEFRAPSIGDLSKRLAEIEDQSSMLCAGAMLWVCEEMIVFQEMENPGIGEAVVAAYRELRKGHISSGMRASEFIVLDVRDDGTVDLASAA